MNTLVSIITAFVANRDTLNVLNTENQIANSDSYTDGKQQELARISNKTCN